MANKTMMTYSTFDSEEEFEESFSIVSHCADTAVLAVIKCQADNDCGPNGKCVSGATATPGASCTDTAATLDLSTCICIPSGL